jgi:membrane associated rhomboid family serine protease
MTLILKIAINILAHFLSLTKGASDTISGLDISSCLYFPQAKQYFYMLMVHKNQPDHC